MMLEAEMFCLQQRHLLCQVNQSNIYAPCLNSSNLITWFMRNTARTTGMGLTQWEKFAVERLSHPQNIRYKATPVHLPS